jgi:hypothetical protein
MGTQWSYWTGRVKWGDTGRGTRKQPEWAWHISLGGNLIVGWNEILGWLSEEGWEIFSVVGIEEATTFIGGGAAGITNGFQIFARKPK